MADTTRTKRRMTQEERAAMQQAALERARSSESLANYGAIFEGFMARGIAEDQIQPRENVLTYNAWRAVGRQVRRGEKGVKVFCYAEIQPDSDDPEAEVVRRPVSATVFHVSQTDEARPS